MWLQIMFVFHPWKSVHILVFYEALFGIANVVQYFKI